MSRVLERAGGDPPRQAPEPLRIGETWESFRAFARAYEGRISREGILLAGRVLESRLEDLSPGIPVELDLRLDDGFVLLAGAARVVWMEADPEHGAPAAGLQFLDLDPFGRELASRLYRNALRRGETPFDPWLAAPPNVEVTPRGDPVPALVPGTEAAAHLASRSDSLDEAAGLRPGRSPSRKTPADVARPRRARPLASTEPDGSGERHPTRRAWLLASTLAVALLAAGLVAWRGLPGRASDAPPDAAEAAVEEAPVQIPGVHQATPYMVETEPVTASEPDPRVLETAAEEPIPAPDAPPRQPRRIDAISWEARDGATVVTLWGDGVFGPESVVTERVDQGLPREVVRVPGIVEPYVESRLLLNTPQVLRLRTGYHPEANGGELRVVADLAGPAITLDRVVPLGRRLEIHFTGG